MEIVLYSTGCPKCKILKKKIEEKGIIYEENNSVDQMLDIGLESAPALSIDGNILLFKDALEWVKKYNT